jgi:hypothetical protein
VVFSINDWRRRFTSVNHIDFEFLTDANGHASPLCLHVFEEHSGIERAYWRDELLAMKRAPFDTGPASVTGAYASNAEWSCFLALGWPLPTYVVDAYVEAIVRINGSSLWPPSWREKKKGKGRPRLPEALRFFGVEPRMSETEKDENLALILNNTTYSNELRRRIQAYNRIDVLETCDLLKVLGPTMNLERALFFGRYMCAAARMEYVGLPVDGEYLQQLLDAWDEIKRHYIRRDDEFGLYDDVDFNRARLFSLIAVRGWDWPRTPTGLYKSDVRTIGKQAGRYPELRSLSRLQGQIAELRINKFANTVGVDGFSRCPLLPFWTKTGRNQPAGADKMFLPGLPAWLHGLIKPPPDMVIIELDFRAEEIGLMAGQSGDPAMIEDYLAGPYMRFAFRAGLAPADATDKTHPEIYALCKIVCLGMNYGMQPYGIAAKTGKSLAWAREIHARHRLAYPVFHHWLDSLIAQARFDEVITSPFQWPQIVTATTSTRSLMNFPAQAGGSDILRIAAITATECGYTIAAPVHDSLWILTPLAELDDTITTMSDIMARAGALVTGGLPIDAKVEYTVRSPQCLGDVRDAKDKGQSLWAEVKALVHQFQQEKPHAQAQAAANPAA